MIHPVDKPHRRLNILTGEWVLVSSHRTNRPWSGQQETVSPDKALAHDPDCYLCPGNTRVSGSINPDYQGCHVFTNDFPALLPAVAGEQHDPADDLHVWQPVSGTSRVICYSPRHDLALQQLPLAEIEGVIKTWIEQSFELGSRYKWIQIFENKGAAMGASNPHPHGQIWAGDFIPSEVKKEDDNQRLYKRKHSRPLLMDYLNQELSGQRIVVENDSWVASVPFWAVWPFETIILPRENIGRITDLDNNLITDLARLLKILLDSYDRLFNVPFPFSMGWHGAPFRIVDSTHWTFHGHIYPPLLRSATVRKFMVGYEMLAEPQRDLTPESAAGYLAALVESIHKNDIMEK